MYIYYIYDLYYTIKMIDIYIYIYIILMVGLFEQ